jgi:PTS system cellobiose-specific IIC component
MIAALNKLTAKLEKPLSKYANKIGSIKYIQALSETFQLLVPITIVGAFACMAYMIDFPFWQNLIAKAPIVTAVGMKIHALTVTLFALYIIVVLPGRYASKLGLQETKSVVPITVATYLMLTPVEIWVNIPAQWLGQQGIISAMLISWAVPSAMKFLVDKNVRIKMPESVPEFVANGFSALIPAFIIIPLAGIINYLMGLTSLETIHNVIYTIIQQPLSGVGISLFGTIIFNVGASLLFFFGIHATAITSIFEPFYAIGAIENLNAWSAGLELPNITVGGFLNLAAGGGMIFASVAFLVFSRSKRYKDVAKLAVVPSLFGICEPIVFGIPIMLNIYLLIPYILTPLVNTVLSYALVATGILGRYNGVQVSFITPFIFNQILTSTTPARAVIWQILQLGLDLLIWYPFIKILDNNEAKRIEKEKEAEESESENVGNLSQEPAAAG